MEKEDLNNFFPTENFSDIKISQLEAKNLSDNLKFFYINNLQLFKKIFDDKFPFKFQEILINRAISPITYIFFEPVYDTYICSFLLLSSVMYFLSSLKCHDFTLQFQLYL